MMRAMLSKPVRFGCRFLGEASPLLCVPLVGSNTDALYKEVQRLPQLAPDAVEVRLDAWHELEKVPVCLKLLRELRQQTTGFPLILTCRRPDEGGFRYVPDAVKFEIYEQAAQEGLADAIDLELAYGSETVQRMRQKLHSSRILLIVSAHNFQQTPPEKELCATLRNAIRAGADIAKLAVMPASEEDVLALFSATLAIRREYPPVPLITMAMGKIGMASRIAGGLFGSDLSFAAGSAASAPGQMPAAELRQCFKSLYM